MRGLPSTPPTNKGDGLMGTQIKIDFNKEISYWHPEQGAEVMSDGTENSLRWGVDVRHLNGFAHVNERSDTPEKAVCEFVMNTLMLPYDLTPDMLRIMDDGRISLTILEDGDGRAIHSNREEDMKANQEQIYIVDYDMIVEIHEVIEQPTVDQLQKLLPKAEV